MTFDPRLTLVRDGVAAQALEGIVPARSYLATTPMQAAVPSAPLRKAPDLAAEQADQLLFGEVFDVLAQEGGWAFGQARRDGYVGYVEAAALIGPPVEITHRVAGLRTYAFAEPNIKSAPVGLYSMNALARIEERDGRFVRAAGTGWFVEAHLAPIGTAETDPAAVAERFLGAPYLWGGRESLGLDCSGLVQAALHACGIACPRDSDLQEALGRPVEREDLRRGDLVFWHEHVAMLVDEGVIIHANGHHMEVAREPLQAAIERIARAGAGAPRAFRRP